MKKQIFKYIACPVCSVADFESESVEVKDRIDEGEIVCRRCRKTYLVSGGIIYLFDRLSKAAEEEKKSHAREQIRNGSTSYFPDEKWLLDFPMVKHMGFDSRTERMRRLISENTLLGLEKFVSGRNKSILEIGAGNCWVTSRLAEKNFCIALDILDSFPNGLAAGEVFIRHRNIHFERVIADMTALPFRPGVFDFVIISSALHHSSDLGKTLQLIKKILKADGRLVLLNEPSMGLFGSSERRQVALDMSNGFHEARYAIWEWKKIFTENGFDFQLFFPSNLCNVLSSRGGFNFFSLLLRYEFVKKITPFMVKPVLSLFDGHFNAVLAKPVELARHQDYPKK